MLSFVLYALCRGLERSLAGRYSVGYDEWEPTGLGRLVYRCFDYAVWDQWTLLVLRRMRLLFCFAARARRREAGGWGGLAQRVQWLRYEASPAFDDIPF